MMVTGLSATLLAVPVSPARADDASHRQEGVTLRLIALAPDAQGRVHGALSVELEPGWKTYWIAPGPVGLAPRLDVSGSAGLTVPTVAFPPPVRFAEGAAQSLGYVEPVAFPISAEAVPGTAPTLRVNAFLGVCRELCVPVQAVLTAEPTDSLSDRALVRRAEAALPSDTGAEAPAVHWSGDRNALVIDVPVRSPFPTDAFVSAGDGWSFGAPTAETSEGTHALTVPILTRPSPSAALESVDLLLTAGESARLSRAVPILPR